MKHENQKNEKLNLSAETNNIVKKDDPMTPEELEIKFLLPSDVSDSESDTDENVPKWCDMKTNVPSDSESDDSDDEHNEDEMKK